LDAGIRGVEAVDIVDRLHGVLSLGPARSTVGRRGIAALGAIARILPRLGIVGLSRFQPIGSRKYTRNVSDSMDRRFVWYRSIVVSSHSSTPDSRANCREIAHRVPHLQSAG